MARLKYYEVEWKNYPKDYSIKLNKEDAEMICRKLIRHFKLTNVAAVRFTKREDCGSCGANIRELPVCWITLAKKNISLGVICHEMAHALEFLKYKKAGHTKKHAILMKRIIAYCVKKEYWYKAEFFEVHDDIKSLSFVAKRSIV